MYGTLIVSGFTHLCHIQCSFSHTRANFQYLFICLKIHFPSHALHNPNNDLHYLCTHTLATSLPPGQTYPSPPNNFSVHRIRSKLYWSESRKIRNIETTLAGFIILCHSQQIWLGFPFCSTYTCIFLATTNSSE